MDRVLACGCLLIQVRFLCFSLRHKGVGKNGASHDNLHDLVSPSMEKNSFLAMPYMGDQT